MSEHLPGLALIVAAAAASSWIWLRIYDSLPKKVDADYVIWLQQRMGDMQRRIDELEALTIKDRERD